MKTLELEHADLSLETYARQAQSEIIILTENKKPVAAVISLKDVSPDDISLSTNPEFLSLIEESRRQIRQKKKRSLQEMKQEFVP